MFYKKYKFPINLFVVFEHTTPILYTSEVLSANHFVCLLNFFWYNAINLILRKDILFSSTTLIEMTTIDTMQYNNLLIDCKITAASVRLLLSNSYYNYTTKLRFTFFFFYSLHKAIALKSIDTIYKNANWMEREISEMFAPIYINKIDNRMLLLDYSKDTHPMLKDFPTESWGELYYDFLDKTLYYSDFIDHIEL